VAGHLAGGDAGPAGLTDPTARLGTGGGSDPGGSGVLNRPPGSVAAIAARVLRSVVSIRVRSGTGGATGSGLVLRADGYLLTNNHVVAQALGGGMIIVSFPGGDTRDLTARIVGRDPETDLAVVKVSVVGRRLVAARLGLSRTLVVGDPVIAVGSPLGLAGTVTTGIVSALNRRVEVPGDAGAQRIPLLNAIQTDAAINPGNSGGPLVDGNGAVIGVNAAIATLGGGSSTDPQGGSIGVGFAIPIDEARSVAEELIRSGRATHPAIGVVAMNVSIADGADRAGARIMSLLAGGPAERAHLQRGDLIVEVAGAPVTSVDDLILALRRHRVGESVPLTFVRDRSTHHATVVLEDRSARRA
ncbi:MAG: trypsin-like peptidase domain-containing protein, partial [Actinomycetota bacterium]|nr:trypsin-like peptidase domain-containing protein [Actinomycetota bacterium]